MLIEESGSDVNRVAPVAQIHVHDSRGIRIRFSRRFHYRSRTRANPRPDSTRARHRAHSPIQIQLDRTRGNEGRRAERNRVRTLDAEKGIGGVVGFTKRCWLGGERNSERVSGGSHRVFGFGLEFGYGLEFGGKGETETELREVLNLLITVECKCDIVSVFGFC